MDQATESNQIFLDAWDLMGQGSPTFERHRGGLVERSWLGHSCPFFNLAVTSRPPSSPTEFRNSIQESSAWAAERGLPWILALCHQTLGDLLPTATALLPELGFAPMMPLTGMEAHQLENPVRDLPSVHRFTEAHASIGDHVMRLNEAAYQMKFGEPGSLAMESPNWWQTPSAMAPATAHAMATVMAPENQPASSAVLLNLAGLRYIALVATLPTEQKKGYAEAALRDVLHRSLSAGLHPRTYLHASAAGRPVYERMGYRPTVDYTVYLKPE